MNLKTMHVTPFEDRGQAFTDFPFVCCAYCGVYRPFALAKEDGWQFLGITPQHSMWVCMYCAAIRDPKSNLLVWGNQSYASYGSWLLYRVYNRNHPGRPENYIALFHKADGPGFYCLVKKHFLRGDLPYIEKRVETVELAVSFLEETMTKEGWTVRGPRPPPYPTEGKKETA